MKNIRQVVTLQDSHGVGVSVSEATLAARRAAGEKFTSVTSYTKKDPNQPYPSGGRAKG